MVSIDLSSLASAAALTGAVLVAGLALQGRRAADTALKDRPSALETLVLAAVYGISLVSVVGLFCGYVGVFRLSVLGVCLFSFVLLRWRPFVIAIKGLRSSKLFAAELLVVALAAFVMVYALVFRSHHIQAFRDEGIYVANGIQLARTGAFTWRDPILAKFGMGEVAHLFTDLGDFFRGQPRYLRLPGYYVRDLVHGTIHPQFLHGYEVWIALAYAIAGPQVATCVNAAFAPLALILVFLVGRRLFGARVGLLGALLWAFHPAFLWYVRLPANEVFVQVLLWGGLLGYAQLRQSHIERHVLDYAKNSDLALLLFPFGTALLTKFSAWLFIPPLAFDLSFHARHKSHLRRSHILMSMLALALLAYLHAFVFADFYLYGMWKFTAGRLGISYDFFPILFLGVSAAFVVLGALFASWSDAIPRWQARFARFAMFGVGLGLPVLWGIQRLAQPAHALQDVWSEASNLDELAMYFPGNFPFLYFGLLALAVAMCRQVAAKQVHVGVGRPTGEQVADAFTYSVVRPGVSLLILLSCAAALFVLRRNLDALHPWAARRWVPVLIPFLCLTNAFGIFEIGSWFAGWRGGKVQFPFHDVAPMRFWGFLPKEQNASRRQFVGSFVSAVLMVVLAWLTFNHLLGKARWLIAVPNSRGAIPQVDKWAELLRADDFVLMQPNFQLAQFGAYLKARFDIDGYVQPNTHDAWARTHDLVCKTGPNGFRRTVYVTDERLDSATSIPLRFLGTRDLNYVSVVEELHAMPRKVEQFHLQVNFYEVAWSHMPRGWCPALGDPIPEQAPAKPPLTLKMDRTAEPYLVSGFFGPTPAGNDRFFRWTDGTGRIALGKLLQFPLEQEKIAVVVTMHSGRTDQSVDVHWYLDFQHPERAAKLAVTKIEPRWAKYRIELDASRLASDSVLDLQSLRPPVGEIQSGVLGVMVEEIRIE